MKWVFKEVDNLENLEIELRKSVYDKEVADLVAYLENFQRLTPEVLPVKSGDQIQLIKVADLALIDVAENYLVLTGAFGQVRTRLRLYQLMDKLANPDFVQVSKQTVVNINHLDYLEASFSGNMTAFLKGKHKTTVSRRYLKQLEARLGL
ncbi:LytTR family DNA-binding domain-containing protein [Streptococcus caprae]|uniref:LytTR family DNA-binding domain-containing protein n=1 Tax=Streptococcus caprae TaxID=1640501 RepID=A0ABV8CT68_9STRE